MENLKIQDIRFGDPDALHEFMKQDKDGSLVLQNSFVAPPRANIDQLESGSKYMIIGPKGSGKTTILLHLMRKSNTDYSRLILFKSNIRSEDRAQLDKLTKMIFVEDQGKYRQEADYRTVWEWYILKNFLRLLGKNDILEGEDLFKDMTLLLEADKEKFSALFDSLRFDGAKGNIKLKIDAGALQTEIGAEILARKVSGDEIPLLDLVRLVQSALSKIKLRSGIKCRLYFDELEFSLEKDGDGERDRRMVRDLLFSIYNTNALFMQCGIDALCYAAVRSEVLNSFPGSSRELSKIVTAFGTQLSWEPQNEQRSAIIDIFENKIIQSEIEKCGSHSDDPISRYFPNEVDGKVFERYILDMGGHKPRGVLLCIMAAADRAWGETEITAQCFDDDDNSFGITMLDEYKEELSATMFEGEVEHTLSLLRGKKHVFDIDEFKRRMKQLNDTSRRQVFILNEDAERILKILYRSGLLGNSYFTEEGNYPRQTWANRGYQSPLLDKKFIIHLSVQKVLQTT